jgi:hypothetical protein
LVDLRAESILPFVLIVSKYFLQPISELTKHQLQICAGRFLEKFDDALAEVLLRFINCAGEVDSGL